MTGSGGFTQTIDWLAFTLPKAEVAEVTKLIGGDWFQSETGFRGYPVAQLMTEGKTGVGKLGTGAPRNPKEVHVDLSAGIVSQWDETKLKTVLAWIFTQKGHVTRIDVALDDREASVAVETVRLAVEAGQLVSRSKQFKVIQASNHREGTRTGETLYFGCPNRRRRRRPPPRFHAGVARPPDGGISGSPMVNEKQVAAPRHVK
ncbi:MAG: replication initiation factor domain-containing protein [Nitrospira sp.]|jgi:phage replication initiation protein|nr:replication initiation factor domain-containing protein [Nitrospira sp.]